MQANLDDVIKIIKNLPVEDYDKIREVLKTEEKAQYPENAAKINAKRNIEVLREFHDDFYNENKDSFTQQELRDALRWILKNYEDQ